MVKITNLNKYFYHHKNNEIHVINNTSFEFPKTGLVTIIGESGSGKTTLMNVIGGLDDFYSGTIEIDDLQIKKYSSKKMDRLRNEKIGYIFQNYLLLQGRTVYDNLRLQLNMYDVSEEEKNERIDYVLKAVGMLKYKKKNVSELSGGQQQRVAIARALIKSPALILADEPTGNLDEKNTIQIMNIIKKISKNTLVILVSHEMAIASSYSDYIIEVSDGKIVKEKSVSDAALYQYEDDQNIYLKEYEYQSIENDNVHIDFYSNEDVKVNIQIVHKNGKFYVKSSDNVIYLEDDSEIKLLDEHKKELIADKEILENDYELEKLVYSKTPSLSLKEKISLSLSNLSKMKKRTVFLAFPLIILIVLTLFAVQSVVSASKVDYQHTAYSDSRIYNVMMDAGTVMESAVSKFGFEEFYEGFIEENPNIEPVLDYKTELEFKLPNFTQLSNKKYRLSGFSVLPLDMLKEEQLLYGRLPENATEIVVEKWVIENAINNSTLNNFMDLYSFINKMVTLLGKYELKIVGIAENDENTVYMNRWLLLNLYPSTLRKQGISVCSYSEFLKYEPNIINKPLSKYEGVLNESVVFAYLDKKMLLNDDKRLAINITSKIDLGKCPFDMIVSDEIYAELYKTILSSNFECLDLYCETQKERGVVNTYIQSVKDYFSSGNLKATEEFGYDLGIPIDFTTIKFDIYAKSNYDNIMAPYEIEASKLVASRVLITFTIILISIIIVFFSMKSYAIKNIYDIGVYRAIGIKKGSIVFVYALEIFIISLYTTLIGGTLCYIVTNIIAGIPLIEAKTAISFPLYLICTLGMIAINVLVGILPVILYMRLTPAKLLTKYDV